MTTLRLPHFLPALLLSAAVALATSNYEYGPNEYVTISNGMSPNGKYAITAHGEGEGGIDNFHLYLTDATSGQNVGALAEVVDTLDTGANAFAAKWSRDSQQVTIVYRIDRHEPLKAVSYRISEGRPRCIKGPFDVKSDELLRYWRRSKPSKKVFGTPKSH